jgi:DNA-binding NarL/FixJ family response regulator
LACPGESRKADGRKARRSHAASAISALGGCRACRDPLVDSGEPVYVHRSFCYGCATSSEHFAGETVTERFERHRQPWTSEELQKLRLLAGKGMALKAIAKAMTRSEESIKDRAKLDGIGIAKLR